MTVAAVLAQRRRRLPQLGDRIVRILEVTVRREQRPTTRLGGVEHAPQRREHRVGDVVDVGHEATQHRGGRGLTRIEHVAWRSRTAKRRAARD